jgi:hypothetical protein
MRVVYAIPLILFGLGSTLQAGAGSDSSLPVVVSPSDGVSLTYLNEVTEFGPTLTFQNTGTVTIHLGYYFEGEQTPDQAYQNGRIHLKPGKSVSVPVVSLPGGLQAVFIRLGDRDLGPIWSKP